MTIAQTIASRLRSARVTAGYASPKEAATGQLGWRYIYKVESEELIPSVLKLRLLAQRYHVSMDYLGGLS